MITNEPEPLFVRSIPSKCTLTTLKDFFSKILHGEFQIKKGKSKGKNKPGFAILAVYDERDKRTLLQDTLILQGVELEIQRYKTPKELFLDASDMLQKRIYINNLPSGTSELEVRHLFSQFGVIENIFYKARIPMIEDHGRDKNNKCPIKCYVDFSTVLEAKNCLKATPLFYKDHKLELYQKLTPTNRHDKSAKRLNFKRPKQPKNIKKAEKKLKKNSRGKRFDNNSHIQNPIKNNESGSKDAKLSTNPLNTQKSEYMILPSYRLGRGKKGKFAIKPFKRRGSEFNDWMDQNVNYFFSYQNLVPISSTASGISQRGDKNHRGYNHSPSNVKLNKIA